MHSRRAPAVESLWHHDAVTTSPKKLAAALLDAQVAWAVGEVTGARLTAVIEREVDALLAAVGGRRVDEVVDRADAKATARRVAEIVRASDVVADLAVEIPVVLHSLPHASDHLLAEVVP